MTLEGRLVNGPLFFGVYMYDKFIEMKQNKPWLFWLLIIPFIFIAAFEIYNKYLINSSKKVMKEAEEKDKDLKEEQLKAEAGAKFHEEKAKQHEENAKKQAKEGWHLNE